MKITIKKRKPIWWGVEYDVATDEGYTKEKIELLLNLPTAKEVAKMTKGKKDDKEIREYVSNWRSPGGGGILDEETGEKIEFSKENFTAFLDCYPNAARELSREFVQLIFGMSKEEVEKKL